MKPNFKDISVIPTDFEPLYLAFQLRFLRNTSSLKSQIKKALCLLLSAKILISTEYKNSDEEKRAGIIIRSILALDYTVKEEKDDLDFFIQEFADLFENFDS